MASEHVLDCIRKKLNEEKIKLWLSPYTLEGQDVGQYPQEMLNRFSVDLSLSNEVIKEHFEQLRYHALEKLASRQKFEATGIAVLKLKVLGTVQERFSSVLKIEVDLSSSGEELCKKVASEVGTSFDSVKLITQGKVLRAHEPLREQNIRNDSLIMVMVHTEKDRHEEKRHQELNQAKRDAELLTKNDTTQPNHSLQIADQNGKVLNLPDQERKSLAVAMTLHEKSRAAMKQKRYEEALPILLEADHEFRQCTSKILDLVDNYALLNLDIVWCYLCLRSINFLPDAERRLNICQSCFDKSYGPNLERLQALKGDKTKERALFTRLRLLQGIVAYHHGNFLSAKVRLHEVKEDLNFLKVDDEKLSQVMGMGYSSTEARLALRMSGGSVEGAVASIIARREEKAIIKKQNDEERKRKMEQHKLGKTLNGEWVNPDFHRSLMSMGYSSTEAQQALQHSENNISLAVQILQEQRYLLKPEVDDAAIAKLVSLGFKPSAAKRALENSQGNLENALAGLISGNDSTSSQGIEDDPTFSLGTTEMLSNIAEAAKDAVNRLAEEIPEDEEDHLDLSMTDEETFLLEYLTLIDSLSPETKT